MGVKIYGSSDDLVEVGGDVTEEFNIPYNTHEETAIIATNVGVVVRITYTEQGVWRIVPIAGQPEQYTIVQAPEDDDDNYSDRCEIHGDIAWVVYGLQFVKR